MHLKNITLEMSLKPFGNTDAASHRTICRRLFTQWAPLCAHTGQVSVLLWVGDGSEILDYAGDPGEQIEWGKYIGRANLKPEELARRRKTDPNAEFKPRLYCDHPACFTYQSLNALIEVIRSVGAEVLQKPIRVGETFDPGPEFAKSPFKYIRHPESCEGAGFEGGFSIVSCYSTLKADQRRYAAFPGGIPDGLPFGDFFAKQVGAFFADIRFDYLWLSNGFGFGNFPWGYEGSIFKDGRFSPGRVAEIQRRNLHFWQVLKRECPHIPIEVRGTNVSTGIDLATDATPNKDIYEGRFIELPAPNSPWAALNKDLGIELAGWMSHIAELPKDDFAFRYYLHDPWWGFTPWIHCYERSPYDIYLPLTVSRVDAGGRVGTPGQLSFLSVDTTYGELPEAPPLEVTPHLIEAFSRAPDAPGPFVWIYPFDEYHRWIGPEAGRIKEVFFGDLAIRNAINAGFPLNTVCSTGNFRGNPDCVAGRVLVSPVPDPGSEWESRLLDHAEKGGGVFLYGPLTGASERLRELLGTGLAEAIEGECALHLAEASVSPPPNFADGSLFIHREIYSGGGLCEIGGRRPLLHAVCGGARRTFAAEAVRGEGRVVWFRGSIDHPIQDNRWLDDGYIHLNDEAGRFSPARFCAALLQRFGWELRYDCPEREILEPVIGIHVNRNGWHFTGAAQNALVDYAIRTPLGAPVLLNSDLRLRNGRALYRFPKAWNGVCRLFVEQDESSTVSCRELHPGPTGIRFVVTGLKHALLRVAPAPGGLKTLKLAPPESRNAVAGGTETRLGLECFRPLERITGSVVISW